jgi:hypothetical protein
MPRNEGFLDPGAGPLASFAWDLRALREKAGKVPYRVLAKRAGFCASTLSVAASGAKLPSLDVTLAYVQACGGEPEEWRARWDALAAQLPPVHPAPDAHLGLEFAPPYDADERGEPTALDTPPLGLQPDNRQSSDLEVPKAVAVVPAVAVATAAADRVPTVERDDAPAEPAPQATALPMPTVSARHGGDPWRRPRLRVIGRVATAALTLATAFLGLKVWSVGTGDSPVAGPPPASARPANTAMQQADTLYALIYQFTPFLSDANGAVWDVNGCRNLSNAQSRLRAIARKRQEQVEQLAELDVSKVPDHSRLVAALKHAWITSAQTDTAYANIAADLQTGCTSGAIRTDPSYQQADADDQAAKAAKTEAAQLWNANADSLGQLHITGAWL